MKLFDGDVLLEELRQLNVNVENTHDGVHFKNCVMDLIHKQPIKNAELKPNIGDDVYTYSTRWSDVMRYTVENIHINSQAVFVRATSGFNWGFKSEQINELTFDSRDIGKTVFLTREQAINHTIIHHMHDRCCKLLHK